MIYICFVFVVSYALRERYYPFLCLIAPRNNQMMVMIRVEGERDRDITTAHMIFLPSQGSYRVINW